VVKSPVWKEEIETNVKFLEMVKELSEKWNINNK
jgi:hypothetical protein